MRTAAIQPQNFRQSLEEALKEAGFCFEEDKLGVERPDGKKKPSPKEGKKKPLAVPHFDNAKRDTNAPFAHGGCLEPKFFSLGSLQVGSTCLDSKDRSDH